METKFQIKSQIKEQSLKKYGQKGVQDKKLKENPKYKQITKVIAPGNTIKSNQFLSD